MSPGVLGSVAKAPRGYPWFLLRTAVGNLTYVGPAYLISHPSLLCSSSELLGPNASSLCWAIITVLNHSLPIITESLPVDIFIPHQEVCFDQPFTDFLSCLQQARKVASGTTSLHGAVSPNGLITRLPALPSQREHQLVYVSQRVWLNHPITVLYKALTEFLEGRGVSKGTCLIKLWPAPQAAGEGLRGGEQTGKTFGGRGDANALTSGHMSSIKGE